MNEMIASARIIIAILCLELLTGGEKVMTTSVAKGGKKHFLGRAWKLSHAMQITSCAQTTTE